MNSELKLVIFEEKKILQSLLELLDEQYSLILSKDICYAWHNLCASDTKHL